MITVILLAIILASAYYVALPFFRKKTVSQGGSAIKNGRLTDLYARRDNLLAAIKEIEFDREMGKMSVEDFTEMNTRYRREAVAVLKRIDALHGENSGARKHEAELRALRSPQRGRSGAFCSVCSAAIGAQDRFCSNCGQRLLN